MAKKYKKRLEGNPLFELDNKLPPHASDFEEAVLGSVILDGYVLDKVMSEFSPAIFYKLQNQLIAEAICSLYAKHEKIDLLTVTQELKNSGELERAGGAYYVTTLTSRVASSANIEYHLKIIQQEALKRSIITICSKGIKKAFDDTEDVFDLYQTLQVEFDGALKEILHYQVKKVGQVHNEILEESKKISKNGVKSGVASGLKMVDNVTNGWQKSDLIIVAGRPGMGKTALAVSAALKPAMMDKTPIAIFSCEMSNQQLVSRMQSYLSEINVSKIVKKQLSKDEIDCIERNASDLNNVPIFIDDTPNISLLELKGKARKLVKDNKVELIIIDYLQLMRSGLNIQNREQEIAEISRGLKALAKELNIPIIALSQLSRIVESRSDRKPMLSDLRESGQIEQDADMVIFCWRPEYYNIENYEVGNEMFDSKGLFMFIIAKHRNGELGEIPLSFIGEQTKITNHSFTSSYRDTTFIKPNTSFEKEQEYENFNTRNAIQNNQDF